MEPQTPRVGRRSLKDQMASTSELLKSLRTPSTSFNSSHHEQSVPSISSPLAVNSSVTAPLEVSSPSNQSSHNEQHQQQPGIQLLPVDDYSPQPRRRASRTFDSHRMSMYSVHGELTYQREAEKQLMATVSTAKKNLRGDFLFVLLERVAVQSIALYNSAEPQQLEDIDALCVMLSDYVKRYAEQAAQRLEQELAPPDQTPMQRNLNGVDRILSSVDRAHDIEILNATAPTPTPRDSSSSRELGTLHETKRESRDKEAHGEYKREHLLQRSSSRGSRNDLRTSSRTESRTHRDPHRDPHRSDSHKSDLHKNVSSPREVSGSTRSASASSSRNSSWRSKSQLNSPPQSPPMPQAARASTPSRSHSRMQEVIEKLRNRK